MHLLQGNAVVVMLGAGMGGANMAGLPVVCEYSLDIEYSLNIVYSLNIH